MSFERTSLAELEENDELVGVAVVHEKFGTGEVVEQRSDMDEVFVEFGRAGEAEYIPAADLEVDSEYYDELGPDDAGFIYAAERRLVELTGPKAFDEVADRSFPISVCHKKGRLVGAGSGSYEVGIELGDVYQHITVSAEYVHERVEL